MIERSEVDTLMKYYGISQEIAILFVDMRQSIRALEDRILMLELGPVDDNF